MKRVKGCEDVSPPRYLTETRGKVTQKELATV